MVLNQAPVLQEAAVYPLKRAYRKLLPQDNVTASFMHGNDVNGEDIKQHNKIRERVLIR